MKMTQYILDYFERNAFGVCTWLAGRMAVRVHKVRLWFIYLSFLTFGSPVFVYLVLMFWKQNSHIFQPWKWGARDHG
ncbi:MAG: hypothetical protein RL220_89 [Bacteroidota bacterium]|jgi:phage shock protein PspC (stress-responsive transcriptional regulator)